MKINLGKREVEAIVYALDLYVDSGDPSGSKLERKAKMVLEKILAIRGKKKPTPPPSKERT